MKKAYSLIAGLNGEEYKKIRDIQKKLSEITGSRKSVEDWLPHITIGDGPLLSVEELVEYEAKLKSFTSDQKPVFTTLKGFTGIDNWKGAKGNITPYVLWVDVKVSEDLQNLFNIIRDEITSRYETWLPRTVTYTPHVTLAFADLSENGYKKGLEYLQTVIVEEAITINHVSLVECYGEGNMTNVEYKRFYFSENL